MAGWTAKETALYIQSLVQLIQLNLEEEYGIKLPKDGRYNRDTHEAFKSALRQAPLPESGVGLSTYADTMDDQGPGGLAYDLFPNVVSVADGRLFAGAWGWWATKQSPKPSQAARVIEEVNAGLKADGDAELTSKDAVQFADIGPAAGGAPGTSKALLILGSLVGLGIAGVIGWSAGKGACPVPPPPAPVRSRPRRRSR